MIIESLEMSHFRNYDRLNIDFSEGINIFYGDNAQGKTNILEALFISGTTKSHKGSRDRELIKLGEEEAHIRVKVSREDISHRIDMHLKKNRTKGIAIDGVPIRKSSELVGLVYVVFFSPEDLGIIKNGPGGRRRFLDMELCQLDKVYLHNLSKYNKVINQRNNLLRQIGLKRELMDTLAVWDIQLLEYGKRIIEARQEFILKLNEQAARIHKRLSGGTENLEIQYDPNTQAQQFEEKLKAARDKDLALKMTNVGPHRDDIRFLIQNTDIRKYGSQGQQRTSALSLKMAEIEMIRSTVNDTPVLLLDDVLSELDRSRQNYLLESIQNIQTVITCTGLEEFIDKRLILDRVYQVKGGTVMRKYNQNRKAQV